MAGAELTRVKPSVTVCMGTSAVQSLLGPKITIAAAKGQVDGTAYGKVIVTRHPSSVLRMREKEECRAALDDSSPTSAAHAGSFAERLRQMQFAETAS